MWAQAFALLLGVSCLPADVEVREHVARLTALVRAGDLRPELLRELADLMERQEAAGGVAVPREEAPHLGRADDVIDGVVTLSSASHARNVALLERAAATSSAIDATACDVEAGERAAEEFLQGHLDWRWDAHGPFSSRDGCAVVSLRLQPPLLSALLRKLQKKQFPDDCTGATVLRETSGTYLGARFNFLAHAYAHVAWRAGRDRGASASLRRSSGATTDVSRDPHRPFERP